MSEPNQLTNEWIVTGLHPIQWDDEHYSQCKMGHAHGTPSNSGRRAISEIDLHSRALSRSDQASRSNHHMIDNHINDNMDDHCPQSIRELEEAANATIERLN